MSDLRDVERWARFCAWLEDRRYNAAYAGQVPAEFRPLVGVDEEASKVREEYELIYWRVGKGWQLRRHYQDRLAALRLGQRVLSEPVQVPLFSLPPS